MALGDSWTGSLAPALAEAIATVAVAGSVRAPESRQDLLDWVDAGLPPIWTWCDYSIARGHSTGEMHEIRIVGEVVALTHHDAAARDGEIVRAEARGRHLACYAMAEALASDQPINGATAAAWRLGRDAAKRLKRMRSIWTAYRWIRAGRDLDALDPAVLGHPLGAAASQFLAVPARPPVVAPPVWEIPDADGSLPSQVREALAALTPKAAVTTPRQLVALVEGGLPPARLRCDGVMHQIQVVGDQLRLRDHDDTDLPSACHGLAESIRGAEPLTRTGRKEAGYPRQHPGEFLSSTQTRRAEQVRTVWLAYRWLKAGHTLAEVGPLLVRGPGPEHGGEWLDAGVAPQQVAAWYGYQDLAGCLRWRRSPHVGPAASLALDEARSSGRWTMRACLALLGDVRRRPPYRYIDDSELKEALRRMRTEATGPAGTADGDLHDWLHRGWIRVTTPDDCLTYRAVLTASGLRRLVALWIRSSWFRQHDLSPPAQVDEKFREVLRFAELVKLLRQADVQEVTVDSSGSITLTNKFDGPTDLADVDRLGLQRRGGPRQRFDRSQRNAVIEHTSAVAGRHGMPLRIDLRRMTAEGPQTRGLAAGAHWCDTVPALLADAIAMVDPAMQPASADEFRNWVEAGLPTVEVRCGEETHQLNVVGERIVYTAHDSALREEDEFMAALSGEPIACYATGETLSGTEPLLDPDDTYRRGVGVLLAAYRTVWLAYRWLTAGRDLHEIAPLLDAGPGPEQAGSWLAAGVPADRVVVWQPLHDLAGYQRWRSWPEVGAVQAAALDRYGIEPEDLDAWQRRGVPAAFLAGWLDRIRDGSVTEDEVPGWVAAGIAGEDHLRYDLAMPLKRFLKWQATGLPPRHIRAYEDSGLKPKIIQGYGQTLGLASDPVRYVIERLGQPPYGDHTRSRVESNARLLLEYSKSW